MRRGERWWPRGLAPERLAPVVAAFDDVAKVPYDWDEARGGYDYWRKAVETIADGRGDCEDHAILLLDRLLVREGRRHEALRLAVVDSGVRTLQPYAEEVDGDWQEVPGVDHGTVLWLPDVDPQLSGAAYEVAWKTSRVYDLDATNDYVGPWDVSGAVLVWSWGLEAGVGTWRRHFAKVAA